MQNVAVVLQLGETRRRRPTVFVVVVRILRDVTENQRIVEFDAAELGIHKVLERKDIEHSRF